MTQRHPTTGTPRICQTCGKSFTSRKAWPANPKLGQFCSRICAVHSRKFTPAIERFWVNVDKNGPVLRPELGPCWLWTGTINQNGYGVFSETMEGKHRNFLATRWIWRHEKGPIPDGLLALHKCDNPPCVRLDHLFPGTQADNVHDMDAKGRRVVVVDHLRAYPPPPRPGELNPHAKLTADDVRAIRSYLEKHPRSGTLLATKYGVTSTTIAHIRLYRTWTNV